MQHQWELEGAMPRQESLEPIGDNNAGIKNSLCVTIFAEAEAVTCFTKPKRPFIVDLLERLAKYAGKDIGRYSELGTRKGRIMTVLG